MDRLARWLRTLWRALSSTRLAVVLLCALALALLVGALFPQMPDGDAEREAWLLAVRARFGRATSLWQALGLFRLHRAPWFLALLAALLLNTAACTLRRLPGLWRGVRWRGGWAEATTLISHAAAVVLVLALAARPALSWQEGGVTLLAGQPFPLNHRPGWRVVAEPLQMDSYPGGESRRPRVRLTLSADGVPVATGDVLPSHPLTWAGVSFHLQGYGPAVHAQTAEGDLYLAFADQQALEIPLPHAGLALRVVRQAQGPPFYVEAFDAAGALVGAGQVANGQQIDLGPTVVTLRGVYYTTWQASYDATFLLAVGAGALLALAAALSLWGPRQQRPMRVSGDGAGVGPADVDRGVRRLPDGSRESDV